jgi:hypothetical protein
MSDWTMAQAKRDFERGLLKSVHIVDTGIDTWAVQITSTLGMDGTGWLLGAKHKEPRQMKTLDAAVEAIRQIGFLVKQLEVCNLKK